MSFQRCPIKNISGDEIQIPWDTNGDKINYYNVSLSSEDLAPGFMYASVYLRPQIEDYYYPVNEAHVDLHASDGFPSSKKTLKPEESVMIRAAGYWDDETLKDIMFKITTDSSTIKLPIYAYWNFRDGRDSKYRGVATSDTIQIELEIPQEESKE